MSCHPHLALCILYSLFSNQLYEVKLCFPRYTSPRGLSILKTVGIPSTIGTEKTVTPTSAGTMHTKSNGHSKDRSQQSRVKTGDPEDNSSRFRYSNCVLLVALSTAACLRPLPGSDCAVPPFPSHSQTWLCTVEIEQVRCVACLQLRVRDKRARAYPASVQYYLSNGEANRRGFCAHVVLSLKARRWEG